MIGAAPRASNRRTARVALLAGITLPLFACALLQDLQPLEFQAAEGGATTDSPLGDGDQRDVIDASADAPVADARTHCSDGKKHDFCDDFEGITGALEDRWNKRKEVSGTGKISAEVRDGAPSPVTVFRTSMDYGADGGTSVHIARLSKQDSPWLRTDGGSQPGVRFAFDVYFEAVDVLPYGVGIANVTIGGGTSIGEDTLILYVRSDGAGNALLNFLEVYGADGGGAQYASKDIPTPVPVGKWTPIELEIQERAPGLNGGVNVTVGTETTPYSLSSGSRVPYFRADLGVSVGSFAGSRSVVLYDNVRIDYLP